MEETYSIFRKFSNLDQANELKTLLAENGIESIVADSSPKLDQIFIGNPVLNYYEVRIEANDFKLAEIILEKNAAELIEQIGKDYYIFDFTDEELYEILIKSDEWSSFDYTLAQKTLAERGKSIDQDVLDSMKEDRIKLLAKPDKSQFSWIIVGYIFAVLGGLLGLGIGYLLWTSKKTLPDGQKVYTYSENDRKHGKYIFYIGLIITPIFLFLNFRSHF